MLQHTHVEEVGAASHRPPQTGRLKLAASNWPPQTGRLGLGYLKPATSNVVVDLAGVSRRSQLVHGHVLGHPAGLAGEHLPARAFGDDAEFVEVGVFDQLEGGTGNHDAAADSTLHHPGGDIDVDAEPVVGPQPLRPAGVHTESDPRRLVDWLGVDLRLSLAARVMERAVAAHHGPTLD